MANKKQRFLGTIGLIVLAILIAMVGRASLDWLVSMRPEWASTIEHVGGWLIGLVVVVIVLLPLFRLYGAYENSKADSTRKCDN